MIDPGYKFPSATVNLIEVPTRRGARVPDFAQLLIGIYSKRGYLRIPIAGDGVAKNLQVTSDGKITPLEDYKFFSPSSFAGKFVDLDYYSNGTGIIWKGDTNKFHEGADFIEMVSRPSAPTITLSSQTISGANVSYASITTDGSTAETGSVVAYKNGTVRTIVATDGAGKYAPVIDPSWTIIGTVESTWQSVTHTNTITSVSAFGARGGLLKLTFANALPSFGTEWGLRVNIGGGYIYIMKTIDSGNKIAIGWTASNFTAPVNVTSADILAGELEVLEFVQIKKPEDGIFGAEEYADDDPYNDLGFAIYTAERGKGFIYAFAVDEDDTMQDIEDAIENMVTKPWFIHALTNDFEIQNDLAAFINNHQNEYMIMSSSIQIGDSFVYDAFETGGTTTIEGTPERYFLYLPDDKDPSLYQVGDTVKVGSTTTTIIGIGADDTGSYVEVDAALSAGTAEFIRSFSNPEEKAEYIAEKAGSWENRAIWPFAQRVGVMDDDGNIVVKPPYMLAVLHTSIYSHIPIRRPKRGLATTFFYKIYDQLDSYRYNELRLMASGGVTVYIQPNPGGPAWALDGLTSDMSDIKNRSQAITMQAFTFARVLSDRIRNLPNERWMMEEAEGVIKRAFSDVYGVTATGPEPIVGRNTRILKIKDDPANPDTGKIVEVQVEVQYGLDFITFNVYY